MPHADNERLRRARRRLNQKAGTRIRAAVFVPVSLFLAAINLWTGGRSRHL